MPRRTSAARGPRKKAASQNKTDPRQSLLLAAKKLFAHKGLSGTTIRDIADEAKANSSMISYYFESKEGLYKECLRQIGETRLKFAEQILTPAANKEEYSVRLRLFVENLFSIYLEDLESGLIIIREYDRVHSPAEKEFKKSFLKLIDMMVQFFTQAQKQKIIRKKEDPFVLAYLLFGIVTSQMRLDHLRERTFGRTLKDPKERALILAHIVDLFEL